MTVDYTDVFFPPVVPPGTGAAEAEIEPTLNATCEFIAASGETVQLTRLKGTTGIWMPPFVLNYDPVPLEAGARFRSTRVEPNKVVIPVCVKGDTHRDYRTQMRNLANALNPLRGPGKLRFFLEDSARELYCYYSGGLDHPEEYPTFGLPEIEFTALDPYWYDSKTESHRFSLAPATFTWFPILPLRMNSTSVQTNVNAQNQGDVETWPIWTLRGSAEGEIRVRNLTTGKTLGLTHRNGPHDTVVIDTRPGQKTATFNYSGNLFSQLSRLSMWPLVPGNNSIELQIPEADATTVMTLEYVPRYLGI